MMYIYLNGDGTTQLNLPIQSVHAKDVGTGTIFTDARELIEFYRGLGGAPDVPAVKYTGQLL